MIACIFHRRKLSESVDAGVEPKPPQAHHLRGCADCRQFYARELAIARGLARGADGERVAPSPFLQTRIMSAVGRAGRPIHPAPGWHRPAWLTAAVALGMVAVFCAVHGPFSPRPTVTKPDVSKLTSQPARLEQNQPGKEKTGLWSRTPETPLETEMRSLLHDARGAAQVLVYNFLPDNLAPPSTGDRGNN